MCARAEELAFSLKVREFGVKFSLERSDVGEGFGKERFGKRMGTKVVAKESDASGNFRGMVPRVGVEEGDGAVEVVSISFGEIGRR